MSKRLMNELATTDITNPLNCKQHLAAIEALTDRFTGNYLTSVCISYDEKIERALEVQDYDRARHYQLILDKAHKGFVA